MTGLAYEIVINSNPCISYIMEENTATMQTLVIAHAAFGHNHFFKNNYLFKQWTDADGILDYLDFAKGLHRALRGALRPRRRRAVLDAAHALMSQGVHRYPRKKRPDLRLRAAPRARAAPSTTSRSTTTSGAPLPQQDAPARGPISPTERRKALLELPQENILYFLEKTAPAPAALAARDPAHRPPRGAVLLPAAPDQGDERGLRHLLPLPDHERACTRRA